MNKDSIYLNRLGIGARPGQRQLFTDNDLTAALDALTDPSTFSMPAGDLPDTLGVAAVFDAFQSAKRARNKERFGAGNGMPSDTMMQDAQNDTGESMSDDLAAMPANIGKLLNQEIAARVNQGLTTDHGFQERLVWFWSNHFSVSAKNNKTRPFVGPYEREVIRPNLTGSFRDLLLAVTRHPAMLLYLDQAGSIGPTSKIGQRRKAGLNENLAREILELHTLGVTGGYSQQDVTEFARALTGWSLVMPGRKRKRPGEAGPLGSFQFIVAAHEPGQRIVMGKTYKQSGEMQAAAILADLAMNPKTARHIAGKLANHFVADDPPESAIDALSDAFLSSGGDLPTVHRVLAGLPEVASSAPQKLKSANEFIISAGRALGVTSLSPREVRDSFSLLGGGPFAAPSPEGWPDDAEDWAAPDALMKRLEWAQTIVPKYKPRRKPEAFAEDALGSALSDTSRQIIRRAETDTQGFVLTLMSPEFQRR